MEVKRLATALAVLALALSSARALAQEDEKPASAPAPAPTATTAPVGSEDSLLPKDWGPPPKKPNPGFGQDEGDEPRLPRIRIEGAFLGALMDSVARFGHTGRSNTIHTHEDLHVPRWVEGARGEIVIKLHDWIAVGCEYLTLRGESSVEPVRKDIRLGGNIPTEVPQGFRASADTELQEVNTSLRLVLADTRTIRAEFCLGASWASFRLGVHPSPPIAMPPLPGGGQTRGTSRSADAFFLPTLGIFFAWNVTSHFGVFVEQHSGYLSTKLGSVISVARAGFRVRVWEGLEVVAGIFIVDGQFYEAQERYEARGRGHIYRQADWIGGGPDIGLSFTY
jgi:hypothetical protein